MRSKFIASALAFSVVLSLGTGAASAQDTSRDDRLFKAADKNGDNLLSREEIRDEIQKLFAEADRNNDATIRMDEIEGADGTVFAAIDTDGSRSLDLEEVTAHKMGQFEQADLNQDGRLTRKEADLAVSN